MDRNYNLKLSDFGFARGHMKPENGVAPLCDTFCGSFAYASPEILRGIPYQPQLADVWSCGVVLYTMVYGALPFDETNWSKLLKVACSGIFLMPYCRSIFISLIHRLAFFFFQGGLLNVRNFIWMCARFSKISSGFCFRTQEAMSD